MPIEAITNGEAGSSVREKLNSVISATNSAPTEIVPAVAREVLVDFSMDPEANWDGSYFDLHTPTETVRVFFNDGVAIPPDAPAGGRLLSVSSTTDANFQADALASALEADAAFSTSITGPIVAITNAVGGVCVAAYEAPGSAYISGSLITEGANAYQRMAAVDGSQLTNVNAATVPAPTTSSRGGVFQSSALSGKGSYVTGVNPAGDFIYASGAPVLLAASNTSINVSQVLFDNKFNTSLYSEYVLKFQGVQPSTDNVALRFQLRSSTPADITDFHRNNAVYGRIDTTQGIGNTASLGGTTGWVFLPNAGNAANELSSGSIRIQVTTGQWTHMDYSAFIANETTQRYSVNGAGSREGTTTNAAGIKVYFSSGNIARGSFQLYGIPRLP